jgi:hypothetical protein
LPLSGTIKKNKKPRLWSGLFYLSPHHLVFAFCAFGCMNKVAEQFTGQVRDALAPERFAGYKPLPTIAVFTHGECQMGLASVVVYFVK